MSVPLNDEFAPKHWFHGPISRQLAERRLLESNLKNAYLVRESTVNQNKCYVLSFLGHVSGINHFRVQHICGHFYIGAKAFPSLEQLLRYYAKNSDLLRNERLVHPIPAPEPLLDLYDTRRRLVAVLPYHKMPESDELSFKKGDVFSLHNDLHNGWLWVTNARTSESGLAFGELLEPMDDSSDENESLEYFHSKISKEEAVERLARAGPGAFLVRPSDHSPGNYSLFFHVENAVQRFRIERRGLRCYVMGGRVFESLEAVIGRYRSEQIVEGFRLQTPVVKELFESRISSEMALRVREKDVYQTLRESREMQKKNKAVVLSGYLTKKSQKQKKWKPYFFALDQKQNHLYFYENDKRQRPKAVVDLTFASVYTCHDSLFDRQFVFQVVERALPCLSTVYYLSAESGDIQRQWTQTLLQFCQNGAQGALEGRSRAREIRQLSIWLIEGAQLPLKCCQNPVIEVQYNGSVKVGRSQVKCPPDPIWEEEFCFDDIPPDVSALSFVLYNKSKGTKKDTEVAEVSLQMAQLKVNEEFEDWFSLSGLCPPVRDHWGAIRARILFQKELILPFDDYSGLKDLLVSQDLEPIRALEQFSRDRYSVATSLLKICNFCRKECHVMANMVQRTVHEAQDTQTLFRGNSLITAMIDLYSKNICHHFLEMALHDPITRVLESKTSCELNPSRLSDPQEACHNAEHLLDILEVFADHIFSKVNECPKNLRFLCGSLQRAAHHKWPEDPLVRTRVVSGFVFLRLICPAILNPKNFSLINEIPSETAARTLILVAKSLQNCANLVEFGTKEPWMEVVNPFILKNKIRIIKYLDDLSLIHETTPPPAHWSVTDGQQLFSEEPVRELAHVHSIYELHAQELQDMANQTGKASLRKLSAVVEMLSSKKQKLTNK